MFIHPCIVSLCFLTAQRTELHTTHTRRTLPSPSEWAWRFHHGLRPPKPMDSTGQKGCGNRNDLHFPALGFFVNKGQQKPKTENPSHPDVWTLKKHVAPEPKEALEVRRVAVDVARLTAPPSPERCERCERCERVPLTAPPSECCERALKALAIEALEVRRDKVGVPASIQKQPNKINKSTHQSTQQVLNTMDFFGYHPLR